MIRVKPRENRSFKRISRICFAVLLATPAAGMAGAHKDVNSMQENVRTPAVADQFYTANPKELREEILGYFDASPPITVGGDVVAIVAPHAGYQYSGSVAARAYRLVRGARFDAVVVISPCHVEHFPYSAVFPGTAYRTPLGDIPVDRELASLIASKSELVKSDMKGHTSGGFQRSEHSLEVQLPFLQIALGDFTLVPIVMGDQSERTVQALGDALGAALAGRNVLIVASTDLSHFHEARAARKLDGIFQDRLRAFDPGALYEALSRESTEACGGGPVVAAMIAAKKLGATACTVLDYANSGDVTGDNTSVVGYVSAVMLKETRGKTAPSDATPRNEAAPQKLSTAAGRSAKAKTAGGSGLADEDKKYLLTFARNVIIAACSDIDLVTPRSPSPSPIMKERRGAFVTLHKNGQLRGCIGYIEAVKPLITTIEEMAKAAAFDDWRFTPVRPEELPHLEIEISVLSPIFEVTDPSTIVVGTHGLIVTRGTNRGLLLPQVATEWKWDRETFLAQTCVKAGLPEDAWKKKGTKIEAFSADVFSEKSLGLR